MKKKTLAYLLIGVMAVAGCTPRKSSTQTPSTGGNPSTPSSTVTPSTPSSPVTPSSPSSPGTEIKHLDPLVREIENPSKTRTYNSDFDEMVEDFSTNGNQKSTLRVPVDSGDAGESGFFPDSPDKAIYKMATGSYELEAYEGIGFRMRKVGEGTLDYSNLVLALRGDDAYNTYPISLADAVDTDAEVLPELTDEYQDIIIAPGQTIEDDTTEYASKDGVNSGVKVLEQILGFHLYATGECAQMIEIEEVFLMNAGEKTVLEDFAIPDMNKKRDDQYWRGSTGVVIRRGAKLKDSKVAVSAEIGDYENLGLTVLGDTSGTTIAPVTASGVGTPVAWSNLKDADGNSVSNAVNGAYYSLTANFANSGISVTDVTGFEINSTTEVYFSEVFLTNFKDKEAATEYPVIDTAKASMFDNFNRTQSGFNGDYDASSTNQTVLDAGLTYALSYNNGDKVTVADGHVTFDATNLAADDYINFKEGNDNAYHGEKYLVLSVKMEEGATLDNFRFDVGNGVKYVNQMVSAPGLAVPMTYNAEYPYTTEDGYTWLVIDLAESGMTASNYIDFYYSGTGKLLIDAVFFANEKSSTVEKEVMNATVADLTNYAWAGCFDNNGGNLVKFVFTSETEGQTLKSIRLEADGAVYWFKDSQVKDAEGNVISADTVIPSEGLSVVVDLAAMGVANLATTVHVHTGGEGQTGDITIKAYVYEEAKYIETEAMNATVADLTNYAWAGCFDNKGGNIVKFTFTSETEGQTLKSIRLEADGAVYWFKDSQVKDAEGNVISADTVIPEGGLEVYVDLAAMGVANLATTVHVHTGGEGQTGDITIKAYTVEVPSKYSEAEVMNATVADLTNYAWAGCFDNKGGNLVKFVFTSETEGQTLKSIRLEADGSVYWFKDAQVKDAEGNVISADTVIPEGGLEVYVDLAAMGVANLTTTVHVHTGGEGQTGDITIKAYTVEDVRYENALGALVQ